MRRSNGGARGTFIIAFALVIAASTYVRAASADDEEELAGLLDEHVLSATAKSAELAKDAPATTSILTAEDIQRYGIRSLDEAINFLGMGLVTQDPLHSVEIGGRGVMITGDYGDHVLLVVDGHVYNEAWGATAYYEQGSGIPLELIDHIELVLGPGAVMYGGGNAMIGVVNVITKRGRDWKGLHLTAAGSLSPQQGRHGNVTSWSPLDAGGTYRLAAGFGHELTLFGLPADIAGQVELYRQNGPSFDFAPQTSANADGTPTDFGPRTALGVWGGRVTKQYATSVPSVYARMHVGELAVTFRATSYRRSTPTLGFNQWYTDFDEPLSYERDRFLSVDVQYTRHLSDRLRVSARGYADAYDYVEHARASNREACAAPTVGLCDSDYKGNSRWMGLELQGEYDWLGGDRLVTVIGANGTIRNIESRIDSTDASNGQLVAVDGGYFATEVVGGAYVQQRWRPFSVLHLNAGTRFDSDPRGGNRLSPRAAAVVDVWHGGELKAIYAEGFRAPSAYEAYSGGSATPNLRAETVRNAEMSFEQRLGRHKLLVGVFRQWFEHMLVLVEPDASTSFYANAEHIDTYGYNARIEGKFGALHYAGSITGAYTREHEPDGTTPLPASPQLFGNARVSYKLPGTLPTIAFASTFVGQRPADRAFDGNFSTTPYAPASADLRLTVSQSISAVPGLSYRIGASLTTGKTTPYVIGPNQSFSADDPARGPAALAPINRFTTFATLHYDLPL